MTSIEWLFEQIEGEGDIQRDVLSNVLEIKISVSNFLEIKRISKEMHKKELGDAWDVAIDKYELRAGNYMRAYEDFDDWYNEIILSKYNK
jgi:hypothetical protein